MREARSKGENTKPKVMLEDFGYKRGARRLTSWFQGVNVRLRYNCTYFKLLD